MFFWQHELINSFNLNWELQTLLTILIISFCNYFIHIFIFLVLAAQQRLSGYSGSYKLIKEIQFNSIAHHVYVQAR